ncbi:sigma-70 family RNA polymerase sigma factor [Micromonospora sp. WMMD1076]|uniref:sigma-70 family RNA polymerase sigma factor n=1 Tax=Micromonospora sp. WMMD1076 TaxID=3016103 RepID=UPI00249C4AC2|nr:sigma-70 family RNA polymerase sigma factor [Micromonospora sp. WMMD1076]WFF07222.1 sigma-70 family RNA polymerase sigma factor [Micromonospora sp. WMMD1076]
MVRPAAGGPASRRAPRPGGGPPSAAGAGPGRAARRGGPVAGRRRRQRGGPARPVGRAAAGGCVVTAAVTAPPRVPGQPGPPAAEQTPDGTWHLVTAAQAGDRDAYGQLYARYRDVVYRFVYFRTSGNRQLAEDLTSETFIRALRRIETVTWQGRDIGAWFITIARNLVADHFKSGRYRLEYTTADVHDPQSGMDRTDRTPAGDPAGATVDYLVSVELLTAVKQLTPEQQDVIIARFIHGLSVIETAAAVNKNEGAVKAIQYRACRTLARLLPPSIRETS